MGRPHWPHWATGTRGLQAGQDLAWGPADTAWNRSRRVLFSPPGPGARLYQSCTVHVAQATCTCLHFLSIIHFHEIRAVNIKVFN